MKTVLINGGSRGIGAEIARTFAKNGYAVAFTYRNSADRAAALAEEIGAVAIRADSASESDVREAVRRAENELGHIDCLVNNAAVSSFRLLTELSLAEWERSLAVNLTGPFLYCREVLSGMIRRAEGSIINISSVWGVVGSSCEAHYSAGKAGLIGLTKALAKEVGPSGIRVNAIAPGVIRTDMNAALTEEDLADLADETPLCRIGMPDEVASCVLFLASDAARFVTGEIMNVSGGFIV